MQREVKKKKIRENVVVVVDSDSLDTHVTDFRNAQQDGGTEPNAFVLKFQNKALLCELFKMKHRSDFTLNQDKNQERLIMKLAKYDSSILSPSLSSSKEKPSDSKSQKLKKEASSSSLSKKSEESLQKRLDLRLAEIKRLRNEISTLRVPQPSSHTQNTTTTTTTTSSHSLESLKSDLSTLESSFQFSLSSLKSEQQHFQESESTKYDAYVKRSRDVLTTLIGSLGNYLLHSTHSTHIHTHTT